MPSPITPAVIGNNVEIMDGPRWSRQRLGTLRMTERGLHFRSTWRALVPFTWSLAWEDVAELQIGGDVAERWSLWLPMKVAHRATHLTIMDRQGRSQGFVVPNRPIERIQNQLRPTMDRWNQGRGASPPGSAL